MNFLHWNLCSYFSKMAGCRCSYFQLKFKADVLRHNALRRTTLLYYRKRGSASYIVREVLSVRERERERDTDRERRKWRHHCRAVWSLERLRMLFHLFHSVTPHIFFLSWCSSFFHSVKIIPVRFLRVNYMEVLHGWKEWRTMVPHPEVVRPP